MKFQLFRVVSALCLSLLTIDLFAAEPAIPDAIDKFMARPEPAFRWSREAVESTSAGKIHSLELVSQTWHDIVWKHALTVYEPAKITHPKQMLLFVSGGSTDRKPSDKDHKFGLQLAAACEAPVAVLSQVPNQPLLGDRKEDDLITETWLRYLQTGDESWPLLFPMVKSAVKAMDALEQFSEKHLDEKVESFVITGASKRGWTSWLTPVVDSRIVGTAPIVIDVLNFMTQTQNQKATWGKYSEQIIDYTSKGLVKTSPADENERERKLRVMMDPFTYRSRLKLPKLLIVGTNDRYWVVDAMNLYWDDLLGSKHILQVPNAGHGLGDGREHALNTLSIFFQHAATGKAMPELSWNLSEGDKTNTLSISAAPQPKQIKLWSATSATLDFRESEWSNRKIEVTKGATKIAIPHPTGGQHQAVFAEVTFMYKDRPYSLTTLVYKE